MYKDAYSYLKLGINQVQHKSDAYIRAITLPLSLLSTQTIYAAWGLFKKREKIELIDFNGNSVFQVHTYVAKKKKSNIYSFECCGELQMMIVVVFINLQKCQGVSTIFPFPFFFIFYFVVTDKHFIRLISIQSHPLLSRHLGSVDNDIYIIYIIVLYTTRFNLSTRDFAFPLCQ